MAGRNPAKAVAAALPLPLSGDGWQVRPMTLGMWAALERIGSPLVTGRTPEDALELLPSLYLLTHDPREALGPGLAEKALEWADTVPVTALASIRRAFDLQIRAVADVVPEDDGTPKKKRTAPSPASSGSAAPSTGGATASACGASRSPSSRCSPGARGSRRGGSSRSR